MATSFYDEMAALAAEMLEEFGGPAQLIRSAPTTAAFDKVAGRPTVVAAPVTVPVRAVVAPQAFETDDGRKDTRTVATLLVEALRGDKLVMGTQTWIVGNVTKIAPIGTPIVFFAEVS
jgi:hypothetical protein